MECPPLGCPPLIRRAESRRNRADGIKKADSGGLRGRDACRPASENQVAHEESPPWVSFCRESFILMRGEAKGKPKFTWADSVACRPGTLARGGAPPRYARDLRPLAAIPIDAIFSSLHRPLRGTPRIAQVPGRRPTGCVGTLLNWGGTLLNAGGGHSSTYNSR